MNFQPVLDNLHFQIAYASGHLYFDRCGQCINDIECSCEGWLNTAVDTQSGSMERPDKSFVLIFNNHQFTFSVQKAFKVDIKDIAKEVAMLWKIIQANLGLDEYIKVGCRINYLLPTQSLEESEKKLQKAELNIDVPKRLTDSGFNIRNRNMLVVLNKSDIDYRIQLRGITRYEAMNPDAIMKTEPRLLSKKQDLFRIARIKQLADYSASPMYAVNLDVDCVFIKPNNISVEEYILGQYKIAETEFLPILEKL
jgi:hypothetical protein